MNRNSYWRQIVDFKFLQTTQYDCFGVVLIPPPISMVQMEKIFSESVLAETLPKPTLVRLLRAKYSDVT